MATSSTEATTAAAVTVDCGDDNNDHEDVKAAGIENSFEDDNTPQDSSSPAALPTLDPQNQSDLKQVVDLLDAAENGEQLLSVLSRLPTNSSLCGHGRTMVRIIQALKSGAFLFTDYKLRPDFPEKYGSLKVQDKQVVLPLAIKALKKGTLHY